MIMVGQFKSENLKSTSLSEMKKFKTKNSRPTPHASITQEYNSGGLKLVVLEYLLMLKNIFK